MRKKLLCMVFMLTVLAAIMPAKASPSGSIVGLWHFDEGTGLVAYDSSGNGNDGTLNLGVTGNTDPALAWVPGRFDDALSFDGMDDYVEVPDADPLDITSALTIEAWIYPNVIDAYKSIVVKGDASVEGIINYGLQIQAEVTAGTLRFFTYSSGAYSFVDSTSQVSAGSWNHIAVTVDAGGEVKFYINGLPAGAGTLGVGPVSTSPLDIGRHKHASDGPSQYFDGIIDEIRIYNEALSPQAIGLHAQGYYDEVMIDIKPGSAPNSINPKSRGVLPVAILGSATLSVQDIDPWSLNLGGAGIAVKKNGKAMFAIEDVSGDGVEDLVVFFRVQELTLTPGTTSLTLTGNMKAEAGGLGFSGTDSVRIVPPQKT